MSYERCQPDLYTAGGRCVVDFTDTAVYKHSTKSFIPGAFPGTSWKDYGFPSRRSF